MIRNPAVLAAFERRLIASEPVDFRANLRMADEMWRWAKKLGQFPGSNLLEGMEIHTRMARVFSSVRRTP
jgi:hypothetical protein